MAELTDYQKDILAKTILGEARGEGDAGMAAVAQVILNRANSGQFSNDPAGVALQPYQFSTWNSGAGGNNPQQFAPGSSQYQRALDIVNRVAGGQIPDATNGALYYHAPSVSPSWSSGVNKYGTTTIGNHIFYNGKPTPPGEIPQVATQLDVNRPSAPVPKTASAALNQQRYLIPANASPGLKAALSALASSGAYSANAPVPRPQYEGTLVRTYAQLNQQPKKSMNLGDSLGMNPVPYRPSSPPMFDAAYDTTTQNMVFAQPAPTQGTGLVKTAPVPASVWDRITAHNTANNSSWMQTIAGLYAGGGPTRPPTMPKPGTASVLDAYRYGLATSDRLLPQGNIPNIGNQGISPQQVAQIGVDANGNAAPVPYPRPATATAVPRPVAPVPFNRPNFGVAGVPPMPATMSANIAQMRQMPPALNVLVQGSNTIQPKPQPVQRPLAMSPTNILRAQYGLTSQQAYDLLNSANHRPDLGERITMGSGGMGASSISG
jgi:hypothetical protein